MGTTDREPSTIEDLREDGRWRTIVLEIMDGPSSYGLDFGELGAVPKECIVAADETVLEYSHKIKGTFNDVYVKSVFISYNEDKRQATATPVCNMMGEMGVLQILCRGTTIACHPSKKNIEHLLHSALHEDHVACKKQTADTWSRLEDRILEEPTKRLNVKNLLPN